MVLQIKCNRGRLGVDMAGIAELIAAKEPELGSDAPAETPAATPKVAAKAEELGVEADDDGKPRAIPYGRFTEVNVKRKDAEARAAKLEQELAAAKKGDERTAAFDKLYGAFQQPLEQMREDAEFAQAVWQLRENPTVKQALAIIQQHHQGATKAMNERTEKTEPAPASDPRIEQLVQERVRDRAETLLNEAKVRAELHGPILAHVMANNPNPTRENVLTLMQEYVNSQCWTREFLRGSGKPKASPLPNPSGLNAGTPKAKDAPAQPAKPKTLSGHEAENRSKFREALAARGVSL